MCRAEGSCFWISYLTLQDGTLDSSSNEDTATETARYSLYDEEDDYIVEDDFEFPVKKVDYFTLVNVSCQITGLPMSVWISPKNERTDVPKLRVSQDYGNSKLVGGWFTVTIEDNPKIIGNTGSIRFKDFMLIEAFIAKNRKVLEDYWNQKGRMVHITALFESLQRI